MLIYQGRLAEQIENTRIVREWNDIPKDIPQYIQEGINHLVVEKLLRRLVLGEDKKVEEMLRKQPGLLVIKGAITDPRKGGFIYVSAWQYMLWSRNKHMADRAFSCVPDDGEFLSDKIRLILIEQRAELEGKGIECPVVDQLTDAFEKKSDSEVMRLLETDALSELKWLSVGKAQREIPTYTHASALYSCGTTLFHPDAGTRRETISPSTTFTSDEQSRFQELEKIRLRLSTMLGKKSELESFVKDESKSAKERSEAFPKLFKLMDEISSVERMIGSKVKELLALLTKLVDDSPAMSSAGAGLHFLDADELFHIARAHNTEDDMDDDKPTCYASAPQ